MHLTGITPPLSDNCLELVRRALQRARDAHVPVSFDINYRAKLWSAEHAARVLRELIQDVTLLFCSRADAEHLFGLDGTPENLTEQLRGLSRAKCVILTLQENGVMAFDGKAIVRAPARHMHILDRLGAGDALAAGVLHGWLNGDLKQGLRYGTTMSALALSQYGDMVITNTSELEQLVQCDHSLLR